MTRMDSVPLGPVNNDGRHCCLSQLGRGRARGVSSRWKPVLLLSVRPHGQPRHRVIWPQMPECGGWEILLETFATACVPTDQQRGHPLGACLKHRRSGPAADLLHRNLHLPVVHAGDLGAGDREKCGSRANQGRGTGTAGPAYHQDTISSCSAGPASEV